MTQRLYPGEGLNGRRSTGEADLYVSCIHFHLFLTQIRSRERGKKKLEKGKIKEIRALSVDFLRVRCPSAMNYVDAGSFDIEFY